MTQVKPKGKPTEFLSGDVRALPKRQLSEETCNKWLYKVGSLPSGEAVQIANYYQDNLLVAQKVRKANKDFFVIGKLPGLYGKWLWRDAGKMVVVTEGEIDALTVSQVQGNKWPVVSLPSGASAAKKDIQRELEWLEKFETVVLMFDMDEPGRKAAAECAELFTPGKCKIASLPLKDANEMLVAGRGAEIIDAIWGAKVARPDGIIGWDELWDVISEEQEEVEAQKYPWSGLNRKLVGLRKRELVTFAAGTGVGKSTMMREIAYSLLQQGQRVGVLMLEEGKADTARSMVSLAMNMPFRQSYPKWYLEMFPELTPPELPQEKRKEGYEKVQGAGRFFLYDHWGSTDVNNLLSKIRYMAKGLQCDYIILDHLSIVVSGSEGDDERRMIDLVVTKLQTLIQECNVGLLMVNHLKRLEGKKGHEDGERVSLSHLRGSGSIAQLSNIVIGINRQPEDNKVSVEVLKNRYTGARGDAGELEYSQETGRLTEVTEARVEF